MIDNMKKAAQDINLSYEAKGLLMYLIASTNGEFRMKDLMPKGKRKGEARLQRMMKELVDAKYVTAPQRIKAQGWTWTPYRISEDLMETKAPSEGG